MPTVLAAVIRDGESISETVDLTGVTAVVGLVMPSDWTAAVVSVQGSADGSFFHDLHDGQSGVELAFNARPNTMVMLNPNRMRSCVAVRLRSGTSGAPVPQQALRQFGIVVEGTPVQPPVTGISAHLIEDASNDFHGVGQPFQFTGANVAVQIWFKSTNRHAGFEIYNLDGGSRAYFDFSTNTAYSNYSWGIGFVPFNLTIEGPGPNGWWTCTGDIVIPQVEGLNFWIGLDSPQQQRAQGEAYQGDGTSFIQVFQPTLTVDGGTNVLIGPDDLTDSAWIPSGATVQNFPDDVLPAP